MRVIIADDSGIVRKVMQGMLERLGHEVIAHTNNGPDAVKLCTEMRPDAVVLDVSMPGDRSGAEAAKDIRAAATVPYIVLCTSMNNEYTRVCAQAATAFRLLKPLHHPTQIERALAGAVDLVPH